MNNYCTKASINDADVLNIIRNNAYSTFLAVSRNAVLRINNLVKQNFFSVDMCVGTVQMDNDEPPVNIYRGMHVVFSQNMDKKNGVVNGQPAIVIMMQGFMVVLQLPHSKRFLCTLSLLQTNRRVTTLLLLNSIAVILLCLPMQRRFVKARGKH